MQKKTSLTNFNVYPLDIACGLSHVDVVVILRVGSSRKDLGWELDGFAPGVLGFGGLARGFIQGGTTRCQGEDGMII